MPGTYNQHALAVFLYAIGKAAEIIREEMSNQAQRLECVCPLQDEIDARIQTAYRVHSDTPEEARRITEVPVHQMMHFAGNIGNNQLLTRIAARAVAAQQRGSTPIARKQAALRSIYADIGIFITGGI